MRDQHGQGLSNLLVEPSLGKFMLLQKLLALLFHPHPRKRSVMALQYSLTSPVSRMSTMVLVTRHLGMSSMIHLVGITRMLWLSMHSTTHPLVFTPDRM
jgi:hypothetical protein